MMVIAVSCIYDHGLYCQEYRSYPFSGHLSLLLWVALRLVDQARTAGITVAEDATLPAAQLLIAFLGVSIATGVSWDQEVLQQPNLVARNPVHYPLHRGGNDFGQHSSI